MKPSPEELEKLIHQTLRNLPERRAPRSLEQRVLAAIENRRALPWWKRSFVEWPIAARSVFLLFSVAAVAVMIGAGMMLTFEVPDFSQLLARPLAVVDALRTALSTLVGFCALVVRNIPPVWLYGGLACLAGLYVTLFGLGATAYRTLYAHR